MTAMQTTLSETSARKLVERGPNFDRRIHTVVFVCSVSHEARWMDQSFSNRRG